MKVKFTILILLSLLCNSIYAQLSERDITNLVNRTKDDYSRTGMLGPKTYKTNSGYRFGIGGKYGQNKPQWQNAGRTRGYRILNCLLLHYCH